MMGVDYSKLESVIQFSNFISALQNPEDLKKLVEDVKTAVAEYKAALGANAVMTEALKTKADVEKKQAKLDEKLKDQKDSADQAAESYSAAKRNFDEMVSKKVQELNDREVSIGLKEKKLTVWEINLTEEATRQATLQNDLVNKQVELQNLEAALKEKSDQIKTLVG